jgi:hypothetical protein
MKRVISFAVFLLVVGVGVIAEDGAVRACVLQEVRDLDDGISPADVIAAAVVSDCLTRLRPCSQVCMQTAVEGARTAVSVDVLRSRASKRRGAAHQ